MSENCSGELEDGAHAAASDGRARTSARAENASTATGPEPSECHCPMCDDPGEVQDLLDLPASQLLAADPALYASWLLWQVEDWADGCRLAFEAGQREEGTDAAVG